MKRLFIPVFLLFSFYSISQSVADTITIKRPLCPVCKSNIDVIPVVYGKPGKETRDKAERGECYLGGCIVSKNSPRHYCKKDKKEF